MDGGFAINNHHIGSIRSNLTSTIRNQYIGAYPDHSNGGTLFSAGIQPDNTVGSIARVRNGQIFLDADVLQFRSESGDPHIGITPATVTYYSPDGNSTMIHTLTNTPDFNLTNTLGDYSIVSNNGGIHIDTSNAANSINFGTNDVDSEIQIGTQGERYINIGACPSFFLGTTTTICSGSGGISISGGEHYAPDQYSSPTLISGMIVAMTANNDLNITSADSSTTKIGPAPTWTATAFTYGSTGTRTITIGSANNSTLAINAPIDTSNGGIAMPANGPNGTTSARWIPVIVNGVNSWILFVS